jgi:hypothetical protein
LWAGNWTDELSSRIHTGTHTHTHTHEKEIGRREGVAGEYEKQTKLDRTIDAAGTRSGWSIKQET